MAAEEAAAAAATTDDVSFQDHPVHEAMVFCSETDAYFQAVAYCPDLVETESPHDLFMNYCDYNLWDASQRLANYWSMRVELFEKPFIPLLEGILDSDKEFLEKGSAAVLPPRQSDGMFVIVNDRYKLSSRSRYKDLLPRQRRSFFLFSECMLRAYYASGKKNGTGEAVLLVRTNNERVAALHSDWKLAQATQRMITSCVCAKIRKNYFIVVDPPNGVIARVAGQALRTNVARLSNWLGKIPSEFHVGTRKELLTSLEAEGFQKDGLPTTMGGTWSYEVDWSLWIFRKQQELAMSSFSPADEDSSAVASLPPPQDVSSSCNNLLFRSPFFAAFLRDEDHHGRVGRIDREGIRPSLVLGAAPQGVFAFPDTANDISIAAASQLPLPFWAESSSSAAGVSTTTRSQQQCCLQRPPPGAEPAVPDSKGAIDGQPLQRDFLEVQVAAPHQRQNPHQQQVSSSTTPSCDLLRSEIVAGSATPLESCSSSRRSKPEGENDNLSNIDMIMKARREARRLKTAAYTRKYRARLKKEKGQKAKQADGDGHNGTGSRGSS